MTDVLHTDLSKNLDIDELIAAHADHQEASKQYLPLLYGNSNDVTVLELQGSNVTDVAVMSLCDALRKNTAVTGIDLRNNHIETGGCHALASMLEVNKTIKSILLSGNMISNEGIKSLLTSLETNSAIRELQINDCNLVGKDMREALHVMVELNGRPACLKESLLSIRAGCVKVVDLSFDPGNRVRELYHDPSMRLDDWAAARLAEVLMGNTHVEVLLLCNQQVGDEGALSLANMLRYNQVLDKLDLFANCVTNAGAEHLMSAIDDNNTITVVNLKATCVSENQVFAIEKKLCLNRQPLYLKKYLPKLLANSPDVCVLQLDEHASCRYYDDISMRLLSEVLHSNTHLTALDLSNNHITQVGVKFLSDALKENKGLCTINLSNNKLGRKGATYLAEALTCNDVLKAVNLSNTSLDDHGGEALANAASENSSLTQLDLSCNPGIRESGAHFVKTIRKTKQLKDLILKDTNVSSLTLRALADCRAVSSEPPILRSIVARLHRGDEALAAVDLSGKRDEFALTDSSAAVLSTILVESYVLTDLNLSNNEITKKGVKSLCDGLNTNRYTLKSLNLSKNNMLDYEVAKMLCKVLRNHKSLCSINLQGNSLLDAGGDVFYEFLTTDMASSILMELDLSNNHMEPTLEKKIQTLIASHKCVVKLKPYIISIFEEKMPPGMLHVDEIEALPDLETPEHVFDLAASVVCKAVEDATEYTGISFKSNRISDAGLTVILELLRANKHFAAFDVSDNRITDAGVADIIALIKERPEVTSIGLSKNKKITADAHAELKYTLRFNNQSDSLKHLLLTVLKNDPANHTIDCTDLRAGSQITDLQLSYICEALNKNNTLRTINFGHNHISLSGAIQLIETLKQECHITSLSLRNNVLDGSGVAKAFSEFLLLPASASLTSLDLSYNEIDEAGVQLLIAALEDNNTLIDLKLQGNCCDDELLGEASRAVKLNRELGVKKLLPLLRENDPTVTSVDLSRMGITDITVYSLCTTLEHNKIVTRIDLSHNRNVTDVSCVNHLSEILQTSVLPLAHLSLAHTAVTSVGACALINALEINTTLEVLDLTNSDLTPGRRVIEAAEKAFEINTTLLTLVLDGTGFSEHEITKITGKNLNGQPLLRMSLPRLEVSDGTLTNLDFSTSDTCDNTTCYLLSEVLVHNTVLACLNLSNSLNINDTGLAYLSTMLHQNRSLTKLSLRSCRIKDEGAMSIASALQVNKVLAIIDLDDNRIGSIGCNKLTNALRHEVYGNDTVKELSLKQNPAIREDSMAALVLQLALNNGPLALKYDLPKIASDEITILSYAETSFNDKYVSILMKALKDNHSVKTMDLSGCDIGWDGGEQIATHLKETNNITSLNLNSNKIGAGATMLAKAMAQNCSVIVFHIEDNECNRFDMEKLRQLVELNKYPFALKQAILRSIDRDPTQAHIDITGLKDVDGEAVLTPVDDEGIMILMDALKTDSAACSLGLPWNSITCKAVQSMCRMLQINSQVQVIDLSHNQIGDEGAMELACVLLTHESLRELDLSFNQITSEGGKYLVKSLEGNYNIRRLCVEHNNVSEPLMEKIRLLEELNHKSKPFCDLFQGVVMGTSRQADIDLEGWLGLGQYDGESTHLIAKAVPMNPHVRSVNLMFCDVTDAQVPMLALLVENSPHLCALRLANNLICSNLQPLVTVLSTNASITHLDLSHNRLGLLASKQLGDLIRSNDTLTELDLSENPLTDIGVKIITEAVKMNDALQHVWVEGKSISKDVQLALELAIDVSYKSVLPT